MIRTEAAEKLLMFQLLEIHKVIHNKSNKIFCKDGFGLQVEQIPVMMVPYYLGIVSQTEIADRISRDKSSVLRTVVSLTHAGLVVVASDPFDKRRKLVQLTVEGKRVASKIADVLSRINDQLFSCFSEEEKNNFRALLNKLAQCTEQA